MSDTTVDLGGSTAGGPGGPAGNETGNDAGNDTAIRGLPGEQRLGPYRLLQQLGEGGMGVVHLGLDERGRAVAVKVLRDHIAYDADARARLAREVKTLSRVQHDAVAPIIDADVTGSRPYLVTRYVPGPSLDRWVAEHGPLRGQGLVRLARGLSEALQAIHAAGVVHRDLKPANVMMLDGEPVLIDFGIAHIADDIRLTVTGQIMGTPGYLSPELLDGGEVTEATDWWGWAATLAFATSGSSPFGRGRIEIVVNRVRTGQFDLSGVDARLAPLLAAALNPDPNLRPARPLIMQALERYADGGDTTQLLPASAISAARSSAPAQQQPAAVGTEPIATSEQTPAQGTATGTVNGTATEPFAVAATPEELATAAGFSTVQAAQTQRQTVGPTRPVPVTAESEDSATYAGFQAARPPVRTSELPAPARWERPPSPVRPAAGSQAAAGARPQPAAQSGPEKGGRQLDPRIGRMNRTGTLAALLTLLAALAAVAPIIALLSGLVWSTLARVADRVVTSMTLKRAQRGARTADVPLAVLATPVHVLPAALSAVVSAVLPVIVGIAATFVGAFGQQIFTGRVSTASRPLPLAMATVVVAFLSWWGIGGTSLRRGSRSLVRGLTPGSVGSGVAGTVLLAAAAYLALRAQASGSRPSWWPLVGDPLSWLGAWV